MRARLSAAVACSGVVAALGASACSLIAPAGPPRSVRPATAQVRLGSAQLGLQVADTPEERSWGLQGREKLREGEGMVFVYDPPEQVTYAIKTVPFALDDVFVSDNGRIARISPLDRSHLRAFSPGRVRYVIELPQGWCARHGVRTGDRVEVRLP